MAKRMIPKIPGRKLSFTREILLLLILMAVIPLLITITSSQLLSRPQLISQSADLMAQTAHTRVQLIDTYLQDRLHDVQTVSTLLSLQEYVQGNTGLKQQAINDLAVGAHNDANYDSWSILNLRGQALLSYPTSPQMHGGNLVTPETLAKLQLSTSALFSGVFYDPGVSSASVVIYRPIANANSKVVGIIRAELGMSYIWNIVNSQSDVTGGYAFILDQRGVRIAYAITNGSTLARSPYLFASIAPLSPADQHLVASQDLYGNSKKPLSLFKDDNLVSIQSDIHAPSRLEMIPAGQQETFEVIRVPISAISWTFFALRPISAITTIADQQMWYTILIALCSLMLAAGIGLSFGRRITRPILQAVSSLLSSSKRLRDLASKEEIMVTEQLWIVESSQMGLNSAHYYMDATVTASHSLVDVASDLMSTLQKLEAPPVVLKQVEALMSATKYIEKASSYQEKSDRSVNKAIRVIKQVTDQLAVGAVSANETSMQLEEVIDQLRKIVGQ